MVTDNNELGYTHKGQSHSPALSFSIKVLVYEYIKSEWYKEPVNYDRSFIAFLNDSYPHLKFEPIPEEKWEVIKALILENLPV